MPRLIIMRHGATEWSKSGQYTSRTDLDLLPEGIVEARDFSEVLVGLAPDAVIRVPEIGHILRSPRKRCEKTLELVLGDETQRRRMGLPEVQIVDDCREWDYGGTSQRLTQRTRDAKYVKWTYAVGNCAQRKSRLATVP